VHITLKICPPYSKWDIESLAKRAGLLLVEVNAFDFKHYPGYKHQTTDPTAKVSLLRNRVLKDTLTPSLGFKPRCSLEDFHIRSSSKRQFSRCFQKTTFKEEEMERTRAKQLERNWKKKLNRLLYSIYASKYL